MQSSFELELEVDLDEECKFSPISPSGKPIQTLVVMTVLGRQTSHQSADTMVVVFNGPRKLDELECLSLLLTQPRLCSFRAYLRAKSIQRR